MVIPSLNKIPRHINSRISGDTNVNVVPGHSWLRLTIETVGEGLLAGLEGLEARIVVVLARVASGQVIAIEDRIVDVVPATERKVQSAQEGGLLVDDHGLLVVRPVHREVGRMHEHAHVRIQRLEQRGRVVAGQVDGDLGLLPEQHVDLDAAAGDAPEHVLEHVRRREGRIPAQVHLGAEEPVGEVDLVAGGEQRLLHGGKVVPPADVPVRGAEALAGERRKPVHAGLDLRHQQREGPLAQPLQAVRSELDLAARQNDRERVLGRVHVHDGGAVQ
mmetsp:Transcript_15977/g.47999  ORF Transcript_15977/g.47999 Transcript_15977/m.47999 type:complete len:275 (+) Transcript_15977:1315-2139(+)